MSIQLQITKEGLNELNECMNKHLKATGPLMPTLHDAQRIFGCIPLEIQKVIAKKLHESVAKINGVVTFYSHFSIEPKGKHVIGVCLGTACYVRGSQGIIDAFSKVLNVNPGETSENGLVTLEATRCIGACGLAPVFTIDGKVYGSATTTLADRLAKEILLNEAQEIS